MQTSTISPPLSQRFEDLGLIEALTNAVRAEGYERPTPIQAKAIPYVLLGRDLLGLAQTGTGKTAAFALPILQRLHKLGYQGGARGPIRVLILTPTRELASQIGESFAVYGRHLGYRHTVIFGGVGHQPQRDRLKSGVDILIATPGRLLDLAGERIVDLSKLDIFVLDEADRMLDMGFIPDVRRVMTMLPPKRQTLFFSATMPPEAQRLADQLLVSPERVAVTPPSSTVDKIAQTLYFVDKGAKRALLEELLRDDKTLRRVLVFAATKHGANRVVEGLEKAGIGAAAIHGNKSQGARERALAQFKSGELRVLVATDIAARGIDIDDITHVINYDLPEVPETYVHRIGRTARAGATGSAIAFCEYEDLEYLEQIEDLARKNTPLADGHEPPDWAHPYLRGERAPKALSRQQRAKRDMREEGRGGGGGRGRGGGGRGGGGGRPGGGGGGRPGGGGGGGRPGGGGGGGRPGGGGGGGGRSGGGGFGGFGGGSRY
ncbi:MAG: DEAD/DEAH box helicase [Kofleriaceae bacterium]